jgi:hypothetical protein
VSDNRDSSLFGLSEHRLERLSIVGHNQDSVDATTDGILNQASLLRFVG